MRKHLHFCDFVLEFWEDDGEIRIKRIRGVDGAVVSYPGADGGEVASKAGLRVGKDTPCRVPPH